MKATAPSLETTLAGLLLACLLLPSAIIGWLAYDRLIESTKADRMRAVGHVAEIRHTQLNQLLRRATDRAHAFMEDIASHCGVRPLRSDCVRQELKTFIHSEGAVGAVLLPSNGVALTVGDIDPTTALPQLPNGQLAWFEPRRPGAGERHYLLPAIERTNGMRLVLRYPAGMIQSIFNDHPELGNSGENFLADTEGYFITSARYPSTQGHGLPISAAPMRRCLSPESSEALDLDYRDVPIIHGFHFVPEIGGGCIMAHIDQAEAFEALNALKWRFGLAVLILAGLAILATRMLARRITAPIARLTEVARQIAAGNRAMRATTDGYRELTNLVVSFNAMTDQLTAFQDDLERQVAEKTASLSASEARLRGIFDNTNTAIASTDMNGRITGFNEAFRAMLGYDADVLRGKTVAEITHPDDVAAEIPLFQTLRSGAQSHYRIEKRFHTADGSILWADTSATAIGNVRDNTRSFFGVIKDITQRKRAEAELNLMARVFTNSGEGIVITDADNRIVAVNESFTRLTGYAEDEVRGHNPKMLSAGRTQPEVYREMWASLHKQGLWEGELWDRRKSGESYPKWTSISVVRNGEGRITNYIGSFSDISERKASEERILHLAHHDALTHLPNRLHLHQRLNQAMNQAKRNNGRVGLLLIDLDRFKAINDTLGHQVGDRLLVEVAERLTAILRESDIVARLGGDEFVVVVTEMLSIGDAAGVAEKIVETISAPYFIADNDLRTSPSIGICIYPDDAGDIDNLMKNADVAMYHAKARGRSRYQFFAENMNIEAAHRMSLESEMRTALESQQFVLHYQPQLDLRNGQITGVEALVRWQHPVRGMVPPLDFIPLAEETGLILPLGDWILEEACRQLKRWQDVELGHLRMSVNLSAKQFHDETLPERITTLLQNAGLGTDRIDLEITESMPMQSPADAITLMQRLSDSGLSLSIDDFGTGHSSLSYLKLFPIDTLKIDRAFVKDIETDPNDANICDVTVLLAHKLGLETVAEGVETSAQLKFLLSIGCEKIQGYLVSKPLPGDELEHFIRNARPLTDLGTVDLWIEKP